MTWLINKACINIFNINHKGLVNFFSHSMTPNSFCSYNIGLNSLHTLAWYSFMYRISSFEQILTSIKFLS